MDIKKKKLLPGTSRSSEILNTNDFAFSGRLSKCLIPLMLVFQPGKVKYLT